jgi:hypothetical protein
MSQYRKTERLGCQTNTKTGNVLGKEKRDLNTSLLARI